MIQIKREFRVPRERLFEAWVSPRLPEQWIRTSLARDVVARVDPRLDGANRVVTRNTGCEVNVLGCRGIGLLGGVAESRQVLGPATRMFLMIGVLGGFTTFSTFAYEAHALVRDGEYLRAGVSTVDTVALCLLSVWIGHQFGSNL